MSEILVYIEQENGKISENSLDLISLAKEISNGRMVSGVLVKNGETDFDKSELEKAIAHYAKRDRRYGGVK